ncbi:MAG: DUF6544 family protein [Burkholderiaceae bacterium]
MRLIAIWVGAVIGLLLLGLFGWRILDHRADGAEMTRLRALQPPDPARFHPAMLDGLPEAAQRFFRFAISAGTPLLRVAEIAMEGRFAMGTKGDPNAVDMTAEQVLAAPDGFVWKMSGGSGFMHISGSDSGVWTRFWLAGLLPVAHIGGNVDHARSAFGRMVAEALIWTPAALLPGAGVTWQSVDPDTARVTVSHGGLVQSVELTVAADGSPVRVVFPRWSDANPDKTFRIQPFGATLSEYREFQGYRLPTHVQAGNFFGTDDYFPFFIVDVTTIRFPGP